MDKDLNRWTQVVLIRIWTDIRTFGTPVTAIILSDSLAVLLFSFLDILFSCSLVLLFSCSLVHD